MINNDKSQIPQTLLFGILCLLFFSLSIGTSPSVIIGILAILVWLVSGIFIKDFKFLYKQEWTLPVFFSIFLHWIGLIWTTDVVKGLTFAKKTYYWLFAFIIASIPSHKTVYFLWAFLSGLTLNVSISIAQYVELIPYINEGLATGLMGRSPYITYSLMLVLGVLMLSFYFSKTTKKWKKTIILILILAYIFNLAIIPGRSGYLAFIALCPVFLYNLMGKKHFFRSIMLSFLVIGLFMLSPTVQQRLNLVLEEINLYYQGNKDTSIGLRLYMWDKSIKIFLDNPIIGVGTGGFEKTVINNYDSTFISVGIDQPHNSFLYMATSFGILGIISILWLFFVFLKKGWRYRKSFTGYSTLIFGLVLLIGSFTDTQILSHTTGILFALFMGMRLDDNENETKITEKIT